MKFIMNLEAIKGKTVKSAALVDGAESLAILFTDDTYIFVDVRYFGGWHELEVINTPDDHVQREAGIITNKEYLAIRKEAEETKVTQRRQSELRELERLTEKYKGGD
jgi:hypothetical protein